MLVDEQRYLWGTRQGCPHSHHVTAFRPLNRSEFQAIKTATSSGSWLQGAWHELRLNSAHRKTNEAQFGACEAPAFHDGERDAILEPPGYSISQWGWEGPARNLTGADLIFFWFNNGAQIFSFHFSVLLDLIRHTFLVGLSHLNFLISVISPSVAAWHPGKSYLCGPATLGQGATTWNQLKEISGFHRQCYQT